MKPEYFLQFLSQTERQVLRWLKTQSEQDRPSDIWAHGLAVQSLRDRGLAKRVRRAFGSCTILTKRGEAVLALAAGQSTLTKSEE